MKKRVTRAKADRIEALLEQEILRFVQNGGTFDGSESPRGFQRRVWAASWPFPGSTCATCAVGAYLVNHSVRSDNNMGACKAFAREVGVPVDFAEGVFYGAANDCGENDPEVLRIFGEETDRNFRLGHRIGRRLREFGDTINEAYGRRP